MTETVPEDVTRSGRASIGTLPPGVRVASFGRRLAAWLIDAALWAVLIVALFWVLQQVMVGGEVPDADDPRLDPVWAIWFPVALLSPFVLTTLAEGSAAGATVGKRALRLRVVPADGRRRVGWGRAAGRSLARLLSAAPLLLGYFACLWDRQHRTWHDHLSRTVVLELPAQPVVLPEPAAAPAAGADAAEAGAASARDPGTTREGPLRVDVDRLGGLADALTGSRHWLEAACVLRIVVAAGDPDEAARYRYCRSLLQAALFRPAVEVASEILAANPRHPGARALHAAAVLGLSNDPASALGAAEAARRPGDALLEAAIAHAWLWRGDRVAARQTAEAAVARYRDGAADEGAALLALAEVLGSKEGMGDEAAREACLRRLLRLAPRDPDVLTAVAASCLRQGRAAEAVPLLLAALRAEPQSLEARQLLAAAGRRRQAALDPAVARQRDQWLRYLQRSAFAGTFPGRLRRAMRLPMGIVPPSSTVLADPTACHCAETTRLYGSPAVEYARVHLGLLHHHGVGVIELRCPTTQAPWVGLEPGVADDQARLLAIDKAWASPGSRGPVGQYL